MTDSRLGKRSSSNVSMVELATPATWSSLKSMLDNTKRHELSLASIQRNLPTGSRLMELGGGGQFTEMLGAAGYHVTVRGGDYRYAELVATTTLFLASTIGGRTSSCGRRRDTRIPL